MNVSLFTVRHVFVEFVKGMESGIRNPESGIRNPESGIRNPESGIRNAESGIRNAEFATLFLLLFVENHFAFTIFFGISFFKIIEYYAGSLRSLLSLL